MRAYIRSQGSRESIGPKYLRLPESIRRRHYMNSSFLERGWALRCIAQRHLYAPEFTTFEMYCWKRWGITRQRAHQIIKAAETAVLTVDPEQLGLAPPVSERVARELGPLRTDLTRLRLTWRDICSTYDRPTAAVVGKVVRGCSHPELPAQDDAIRIDWAFANLGFHSSVTLTNCEERIGRATDRRPNGQFTGESLLPEAGGRRIQALRQETDVYLLYDELGVLLYVGISLSLARRLGSHRSGQTWWSCVARIDVEHHPTRRGALARERTLIRERDPLHNVAEKVGC